ncbi:MAG: ATP-binding protein [Candidatus Marinimicrobia bacterium]|nr:ATP-binding protein [Candidatus Neomarinimicrobiota bacterium]
MKRTLYKQLKKWKNDAHRKPLLLQGARQVGKTYLVNSFGKNAYSNFVYLNFEENDELKTLFEGSLSSENIINNISLYFGRKIDSNDTLIFFDEIQDCPSALTSLKYFKEQSPNYHIISAGSLLGVSIGNQRGFPVGMVNFMTLYPLTFHEYLCAFGEDLLAEKLSDMDSPGPFPEIIHDKLNNHLKMYLYLGGMPEVLQSYIDEKDIQKARYIQLEILEAYQRDFAKYTTELQAIKTSELWRSVPIQLAKENKKFKYSVVRKKARASTFVHTIEWLKGAGLIHIVNQIKSPKLPLAGYADHSKFKLYLHDTGLLGAMLNLTSNMIIKPTKLFAEFNGAFIENYVASELIAQNYKELYYWTSKSEAEVDFILNFENDIYPLEVKSGLNRNLKSLRSYAGKYKPKMIIRISPRNFIRDQEFVNIPLYSVSTIKKIIALCNT